MLAWHTRSTYGMVGGALGSKLAVLLGITHDGVGGVVHTRIHPDVDLGFLCLAIPIDS